MIKAILIDGYGQCVKQMHIKPSFHDIEEVIGSAWWEQPPTLLDNGDVVYWTPVSVDCIQNGVGLFAYQGRVYHGNTLIARIDSYGDLMDCRTELASVRPCVVWK